MYSFEASKVAYTQKNDPSNFVLETPRKHSLTSVAQMCIQVKFLRLILEKKIILDVETICQCTFTQECNVGSDVSTSGFGFMENSYDHHEELY